MPHEFRSSLFNSIVYTLQKVGPSNNLLISKITPDQFNRQRRTVHGLNVFLSSTSCNMSNPLGENRHPTTLERSLDLKVYDWFPVGTFGRKSFSLQIQTKKLRRDVSDEGSSNRFRRNIVSMVILGLSSLWSDVITKIHTENPPDLNRSILLRVNSITR